MLIRTRKLVKLYRMGDTEVHALDGVDLDIDKGEFVAVMGPSGSGKSTFMNIVGCLDLPTSGDYWLDGRAVSEMDGDQLAAVRNRHVGFVFQHFNLLARTPAIENVALPLIYAGIPRQQRTERAMAMLERVALGTRAHHHPSQLSGGQQQRVAIVRALAMQPDLLLLDEVTSALDPELVAEVLDVIRELAAGGMTMVIATHEMGFARDIASRVCFLEAGTILEEGPPEQIFSAPREPRTQQFLQRIVDAGRL